MLITVMPFKAANTIKNIPVNMPPINEDFPMEAEIRG